ncbi:MAG: hypothetical protein PHO29_08240 [Acetobacterium sp.]|nr:hypothetical protein [Acetobacterium sp.]
MRMKRMIALLFIFMAINVFLPTNLIYSEGEKSNNYSSEVQFSLGGNHSGLLKSDGTLWLWGWNDHGELGNGTTQAQYTPVKIMDNVQVMSIGYKYSAAIKTDGSLWVWGNNSNGQLGTGTTSDEYRPVKIMDDVKSVSLGIYHSAAIKNDNSLWMWGKNNYGQLGIGTQESVYFPVKVMDNVKSVDVGNATSGIIMTDDSLWMCGSNDKGELGDGTTQNKLWPKKVMDNVKSVSLSKMGSISTAVKTDNTLWQWGYVGLRSQTSNVPLYVVDNVKEARVGAGHVGVIKNDNSLWMYGFNWQKQVGTGEGSDWEPITKIMENVKQISLAYYGSAALTTNGDLWIWGYPHVRGGNGVIDAVLDTYDVPTMFLDLGSIISYRTHVENEGWQIWRSYGEMSGTRGKSLRLEGIEMKLDRSEYDLGVQYATHIENIGWQDFVKDGAMSGTTGKGLRLEAIKIRLTGNDAKQFDIYYRVHAQNVGWLDWAKNGAGSGTAGFGYRLEGIQIVVVKKGETPPGLTIRPFVQK